MILKFTGDDFERFSCSVRCKFSRMTHGHFHFHPKYFSCLVWFNIIWFFLYMYLCSLVFPDETLFADGKQVK